MVKTQESVATNMKIFFLIGMNATNPKRKRPLGQKQFTQQCIYFSVMFLIFKRINETNSFTNYSAFSCNECDFLPLYFVYSNERFVHSFLIYLLLLLYCYYGFVCSFCRSLVRVLCLSFSSLQFSLSLFVFQFFFSRVFSQFFFLFAKQYMYYFYLLV